MAERSFSEIIADFTNLGKIVISDLFSMFMSDIEVTDQVENDFGDEGFGADGGRIEERLTAEGMRVVAEDFALAGGGADLGFNA